MRHFGILVLSVVLFFACAKKTEFSYLHNFPNQQWEKDDVFSVSFDVIDSTALYDILLKITNTEEYHFANLYLFTSTYFPNNSFMRDTVEFLLSDNTGKWTGKGWFSYTNSFLFRKAVRFPHTGKYTFSFEQAMRCKKSVCSVKGLKSMEFLLVKR